MAEPLSHAIFQRVIRMAKAVVPEAIKRRWRGFRWPLWAVRRLPGTSAHYGPARRWVTAASYCGTHGGTLREVLPVQALPPLQVVECGPIPARFYARYQASVPAASILELQNVRLLGPDGWIVGRCDSYLLDASYWAYPDPDMDFHNHYMLSRRRPPALRRLKGRTLSLASDFAVGGFGHFIHDSVPRLHLVERAGIDPRDFDWIYWPHVRSPATESLLRASGLPREKILSWPDRHDLQCDHVTATTFPGRPAHLVPVYAEFLRRRFAPTPLGASRRLYLTRTGFRRNFRNATALEEILATHGYESCHPHSDPDVFAKCAAATHVVAIEGANFFNVFACPSGTKVLLILPDASQNLPYAITLALSAGHHLHLLAARSLDQPAIDPGIADIFLEPGALASALQQMDAT